MCATLLSIIVMLKLLSYSEISAIFCSFSVFTLFLNLETSQLFGENAVILVIFGTCDVICNWSISLLPPIVLDNLFNLNQFSPFIFLLARTLRPNKVIKSHREGGY